MSALPAIGWAAAALFALLALLLLALLLATRRSMTLLMRAGADGLAIVNATGTVLFVNDSAPKLLGRSRRELVGHLFIAPDVCGENTEITVLDEHGQPRVIEIRKQKVRWRGRPAHVLHLRDVSRRKAMQEALRAREEQFKAMVANVPGVVYQWSERAGGECDFRFLSPRGEEQLGIDAPTLRRQWHIPRLYPREADRWNEALENARNERVDWSFERAIRTREGQVKWLRDISRPFVAPDGREVFFNGLLLDITSQKRREDRLGEERRLIEQANRALADKNRQVGESIEYARSIQHRVLPDIEAILANFSDAFVYLRPRDVVSGDFYWFTRFAGIRLLVCADCTGHGVPGALMTLLGNDLLHTILTDHLARHPDELLEQLDIQFARLSGGTALPLRDGMELAACSLSGEGRLVYAGARLPLFLARKGRDVEVMRGAARAIGEAPARRKAHPFEARTFRLEHGDAFYLATDGFQDQHGGPEKRKFSRRQLVRLLAELAPRPMAEQARRLNQRFEEWKGNLSQRDDVLVMGVRIEAPGPAIEPVRSN